MARYKVQGPDGAVHVFEGPDGATPEQVTAFAAQTFGGQRQTPQQSEYAPEDPGALGAALIGAGRTTDRIVKGMQQLYYGATGNQAKLDELAATKAEDDRVNRPLIERHPIASAVGESLPSMAVPVGGAATLGGTAARLAAAGALPGALEYGSAGERAGRAAGGAAAGVVGGIVVPKAVRATVEAVPALQRTVRAVADPLTAAGRDRIVGRSLNNAAGADAQAAAARMAGAAPLVPGSLPTAAQVAENGGLAALERAIAARAPADFTTRNMEQAAARLQAVRGIAQDDAARAAAVSERGRVTGPMYQQATRANYTMDAELQSLLQRPDMRDALRQAERLAANNGRRLSFDVAPVNTFAGVGAPGQGSRQVTGQGLQDLKMAIDQMLADPASGFAGAAGRSLRDQRGQLLGWMERANPEFRNARQTFSSMTQPINQMDIGRELLNRIEPALNDYGQLGSETAAKFATALRNADQTARTATQFKGASLADIMTPDQMGALQAVAGDLARKANAQNLGRGAGSNTFQNFAMDNIAAQSGAPRVMGAAMNLPGVSKLSKFLYAGPEEQIQSRIAQALLDPQDAARLMQSSPVAPPINPRELLLSNPGRAARIGGAATGLSIADFFAQ